MKVSSTKLMRRPCQCRMPQRRRSLRLPRGMATREPAANSALASGENVRFTVAVAMEGLKPEDIVVELLMASATRELPAARKPRGHAFQYSGERGESGEYLFTLDLSPQLCGKLEYRIRAFPTHPLLSHRFEMGLMRWI